MHVRQIARHRPFAAAALLVPLLVIAYHFLAYGLGGYWAVPPQYDMLYMTNYADGTANGVSYEIKDNRLRFYYRGENYGYGWPRLFRFNPSSGRYWEIPIHVPPYLPKRTQRNRDFFDKDANHVRPVPVPEIDHLNVVGTLRAPDGYQFERLQEGREDFYRMFSSEDYPLLGYVSKAGRHFPLGAPPGPRTKENVTFVGWVIS